MKFMKLGCRPDTFYTSEAVRSVSSEASSDLIIQVKTCRYLLHQLPMLSKCLRLQKLISSGSPETSQHQIIQLSDFPGGCEIFELCAKFCYGITITLSARNIVAARCAAEYLQMNEEAAEGNLIQKLELFLTSCVLNAWNDSIVTLQSTKALPLWSEDLGITGRCIEAISKKILEDSLKISLSRNDSRRERESFSYNGYKPGVSPWWGEDMAELGIDLYWRSMVAIKSTGKVPSRLIGDALEIYTKKWLANISKDEKSDKNDKKWVPDLDSDSDSGCSKKRLLLESVMSLLPAEKGSISCHFLLKLLKVANFLNASPSSKIDLARKAGLQLDEATVGDLLIPLSPYKSDKLYDVDVVMTMLEEFMSQSAISPPTSPPRSRLRIERPKWRSEENISFELQESRRSSSASHGSKIKVAKIIDGYLQEIARDANLPLEKFITLAEMVPEFSRVDHDDLYKAIDIYLKAHPGLTKSERKRLCRILDCKKLSMEASKHAAQNESLPLRLIVQVLFFEQVRGTLFSGNTLDMPSNDHQTLLADPSRQHATLSRNRTRVSSTLRSKLAEEDELGGNGLNPGGFGRSTPSRFKAFSAIQRQPKRIFNKLLSMNRSLSQKN